MPNDYSSPYKEFGLRGQHVSQAPERRPVRIPVFGKLPKSVKKKGRAGCPYCNPAMPRKACGLCKGKGVLQVNNQGVR